MKDSKYDDGIDPEHKEDAIRKTPGKHPADFGTAAQPAIFAGIRGNARDCGMDFGDEFFA